MASTNKTANYELSQFLGSDKPAWLSDYNTDMSKIDAQMKLNADGVVSASGSASTANTAIGTLANLTTDAKTDLVSAINEVDSHADSAFNTATSVGTTASGADIKADTALAGLNRFNLTNKSVLTASVSNGTVNNEYTNVQFATDSTSSIFKLYGRLYVQGLSSFTGTLTITFSQTSLRPTEAYEINAGALASRFEVQGSNTFWDVTPCNVNVATNGVITIQVNILANTETLNLILPPCLYFNEDFGDE